MKPQIESLRDVGISVIISTRNRCDLLEQTLRLLSKQVAQAFTWEVVVVDNGSTDRTSDVLAEMAPDVPLVALSEPVPGKNRALNRAVDRARGDLFIFTDDDIIPKSTWLDSYWSAAQRWPRASIFGGPVMPRFPDNTPAWITFEEDRKRRTMLFGELYRDETIERELDELPFGANLCLRSKLFDSYRYCESVGPAGTNYAMGSETELLKRLQASGETTVVVPDAIVEHIILPHQVSTQSILRRAYRFGRGTIAGQASSPPGRYVAGAPLWMWRRLIPVWAKHLALLPLPPRLRFDTAFTAWRYLGALHECQARHSRSTDESRSNRKDA